MKKTIKNTSIIAVAMIITFSFVGTQAIFAADKSETPVELNYVANSAKLSIFQLKLNNKAGNKFMVTIKDQNGDVIYSEKVAGADISRTYELKGEDNELNESTQFQFDVRNIETNEKHTYLVKKDSHLVEDVVINKL